MRGLLLALLLLAPLSAQAQFVPMPGQTTIQAAPSASIAFVAAANVGNNGGSGNFSGSYTAGAGSHRLLVVCVVGDSVNQPDSLPVATFNSVSMTKAVTQQTTGGRWLYQFFLLNPASGSHTLAITQTGGTYLIITGADYTGVLQSGQPDNTAHNDTGGVSQTSLTTAITVNNTNSWAMTCQMNPSSTPAGGANATLRQVGDFTNVGQFDSNAGLSTGSKNVTTTAGSSQFGNVVVTYQPG